MISRRAQKWLPVGMASTPGAESSAQILSGVPKPGTGVSPVSPPEAGGGVLAVHHHEVEPEHAPQFRHVLRDGGASRASDDIAAKQDLHRRRRAATAAVAREAGGATTAVGMLTSVARLRRWEPYTD